MNLNSCDVRSSGGSCREVIIDNDDNGLDYPGLASTRQRSNLAGGAVRDESSEADDLSIEDCDAVELFCQDRNLPRLLWRPSPTTPHPTLPFSSSCLAPRKLAENRGKPFRFSSFLHRALPPSPSPLWQKPDVTICHLHFVFTACHSPV